MYQLQQGFAYSKRFDSAALASILFGALGYRKVLAFYSSIKAFYIYDRN